MKSKAKKRTPRQIAVDKLDKLVSRFIRDRDQACVVCGKTVNLQNGHLFSRVHTSTRFDTRPDGNCHTQCSGCNLLHENDPFPYNNWYIQKFGLERWQKLYAESKTPVKWSTADLELLYIDMKKRVEAGERLPSGGV